MKPPHIQRLINVGKINKNYKKLISAQDIIWRGLSSDVLDKYDKLFRRISELYSVLYTLDIKTRDIDAYMYKYDK